MLMFHGRCRLARFAIPARYGMVCVLPFIRSCRLLILLTPSHSLEKSLEYVILMIIGRQRKRKQLFSRYVRMHAP